MEKHLKLTLQIIQNWLINFQQKGVSIVATPQEDKMPSLWEFYYHGSNYYLLVFGYFYASDARWQRRCYGIWTVKSNY